MKKFNTIKTTLDNKHNEIIKSFKHNEEVVIPKYLKQIEKLELMLNKSKKKMELLDNINKCKNIIKSLKNKEKNYYLNNSKYIFDYF
jgi:glycerol-3-phosphate responsive antiterminator